MALTWKPMCHKLRNSTASRARLAGLGTWISGSVPTDLVSVWWMVCDQRLKTGSLTEAKQVAQ